MDAQKFMNENRISECWECDGTLFKHKENAEARAKTSGKDVIPHTINAGVRSAETAAEQ